ncbi:FAD-dependent monooxygenase [Solicola sp. PLA-1-18]|uniref:FAD-dependent monooxygenase n=1 Tax=Solicola sp. PLA-1-18 TaxID=3380532 RepID=UPI003B7F78EB
MTDRPSVLISGASVAGPAAAWWLDRAGWDVTVVERFDSLRDDGQNVDVRGTARQVIEKMGLLAAARDHHTSETGMSFVDERGRVYASFPSDAGDLNSATADLEILRGQLARLLHDHSSNTADYVFGDQIEALHDDGDGVDVTFVRGPARRFDAVVIAEGYRSRTRSLVMPDADTDVDELGIVWTYFTIPRHADDDRQWRLHVGGDGRLVHLRPDNVGTTRAMLSLRTNTRGLGRLDPDAITDVLRATFGDLGWQTPRILDALRDATPYVDEIAQVRLSTWHRGRVVLLGDAAWNAGPFGTGTTSALTGAYVLADELAASPDDITGAFTRYERTLRPMTDHAQKFDPYNMHPRGPRQATALRAMLRTMGSRPGQMVCRLAGLNPSPPVNTIELPRYGLLDADESDRAARSLS